MTDEDKINTEFIAFFQTPFDRVKYLLPGMDKSVSMEYHKFRKFLSKNFYIKHIDKIINSLDSFETVILINETGEFDIIKSKKSPFDVSFDDLYKYNEEKEKKEDSLDLNSKLSNNYDMVREKIIKSFNNFRSKKSIHGVRNDRSTGNIRRGRI